MAVRDIVVYTLAAACWTGCADGKGVSLGPDETDSTLGEDSGVPVDASAAADAASSPDGSAELDAGTGDDLSGADASAGDASAADAALKPDGGAAANDGCGELTYLNFGQGFMESWCLSCHTLLEPKFTTLELVRASSGSIRAEAVDSRRMPEGGNADLSDAERAQLGRWLACGAP